MSNKGNGSLQFPYASMDQAIQDKFAKIGGPVDAFATLAMGWKQGIWRKQSNDRTKERQEVALEAMAQYIKDHPESKQARRYAELSPKKAGK